MSQKVLNTAVVDLLKRFIAQERDDCAGILFDCEKEFLAELTPSDHILYQISGVTWQEFVDEYVDKAIWDSFHAFLSSANHTELSPWLFRNMVSTGLVQVLVNGEAKKLDIPGTYFELLEIDADASVFW